MTRAARASAFPRACAWPALALASAAASVWRVLADGQDLNFDLVTYHFYLGHTLFADRAAVDFLPAGFQGYQSPLPYALLAGLDRLGVAPILNAALHAVLHSLNLVLLYILSGFLGAAAAPAPRRSAVFALWLLGAVAPVYWLLVGTSFADLTTSVFVLGSVLCITVAHGASADAPRKAAALLLAAGLLMGGAAGMRMHNCIYVVAAAAAVAMTWPGGAARRSRALAAFAGTACVAGLAMAAPWAWRTYREFGNPVFPFFNGFFRAPDFPSVDLPLTNFIARDASEWLALPFRMATHADWIYVESRLPDVRPALLVVTLLGLVVWRLFHSGVTRTPGDAAAAPQARFVFAFFGIGSLLWAVTSSNGRYGVALFLLGGPVCGALLLRLLAMRHVLLVVAGVCIWQGAVLYVFMNLPRWTSAAWSERYFDWDIPPSVAKSPGTFLSFGYQAASTLVPRLHPDSGHVNLVGQYSPAWDGPGASRIRGIVETPNRPIHGAFDVRFLRQAGLPTRSIKDYFEAHLLLWGLTFRPEPCTLVGLKPAGTRWEGVNRLFRVRNLGEQPELLLCALQAAPRDRIERARLDLATFRTALAPATVGCPEALGGPMSIVRHPGEWTVMGFGSLEYRLEFRDDNSIVLQQLRPPYAAAGLRAAGRDDGGIWWRDCAHWPVRLAAASRSGER